jgi:hypothetical protein
MPRKWQIREVLDLNAMVWPKMNGFNPGKKILSSWAWFILGKWKILRSKASHYGNMGCRVFLAGGTKLKSLLPKN